MSRVNALKALRTAITAALAFMYAHVALADEGGVSFWIPGFFGSRRLMSASPSCGHPAV
jgi:hypothetical protein